MNGLENQKDSTKGKFKGPHIPLDRNTYIYILPGIPIPLQRHQHGQGNTWDAQKQKKVKTGISISALHGSRARYEGPLHLDIKFYFPIPQRGLRSKSLESRSYHFFKPDISNCIKYIEDVCSKLLFDDDCLISSVYSEKLYDHTPRTEFFFIELNTKNE